MINVLKASRAHPAEEWIAMAVGVTDPYGNPFQLIELLWNKGNKLRRATEYMKTRGDIDDTIITADEVDGGVKISYRKNGSVMWIRKNGIGPYVGELARTPKNIQFLVTNYRDGDWTIKAPLSVENEVRALYEKWYEGLTDAQKDAEEKRIRLKNTHYQARRDEPIQPVVADKAIEAERAKSLAIREAQLNDRELELEAREKALLDADAGLIKEGGKVTTYSKRYLSGLRHTEIKTIAKNLGIATKNTDKSETVINMIVESQKPPVSTDPEKVTG